MKFKWLRKKAKRDRSKDWNRHYRVCERLVLRMNEAADRLDVDRVEVLANRIRHVRDIQIADLGN